MDKLIDSYSVKELLNLASKYQIPGRSKWKVKSIIVSTMKKWFIENQSDILLKYTVTNDRISPSNSSSSSIVQLTPSSILPSNIIKSQPVIIPPGSPEPIKPKLILNSKVDFNIIENNDYTPTAIEIQNYFKAQQNLPSNRAPPANTNLNSLFNPNMKLAFFDNTEHMIKMTISNIFDGKYILIRPRRSGKTTFGYLWLEFFKGNKDLIQNFKISKLIPIPEKGKYICVHLDLGTKDENPVKHIMSRINEALNENNLESLPFENSIADVIESFANYIKKKGKQAVMFIDEYDGWVINATPSQYEKSVTDTGALFTKLKATSQTIPLAFITGSSRIAISGIWSGGNDILDLTYRDEWSSALGYTWENIEILYSNQLTMLENLYRINRSQLRKKMELMYGSYLFSPNSSDPVFSIFSINQCIGNGVFNNYLTNTGLTKTLITGAFASSSLEVLATSKVSVSFDSILAWRYPDPGEPIDTMTSYMELHGAGILSFMFGNDKDKVFLRIPNEDALYALTRVLLKFANGVSPENFNDLLKNGRIIDAIRIIQNKLSEIAISTGTNSITDDQILEYHLQNSFFALLEILKIKLRGSACWYHTSETKVTSGGRADFVLHVTKNDGSVISYIIEMGRFKTNLPTKQASKLLLIEKLIQASNYVDQIIQAGLSENINIKGMVVVALWTLDATLTYTAGPFTSIEAKAEAEKIKQTL